MKKLILTIALLIPALGSFAQADSGFVVRKGILAGVGTVGIGQMTSLHISNAYVTGNLEYYAQRTVSIRGDGYFFVNSLTQNSPLKQNSAVYFGAFYHFPTHSGFDPLIGFQPGLSVTKMVAPNIYGNPGIYYDAATACPLASIVAGFNFFGEKWFHIQANVRYTIGNYTASGNEGLYADEHNISELSFNFGLGWNINLHKKKKGSNIIGVDF